MLDFLPVLLLTAAWGMHCGGTRMQGGTHCSHPNKRGGGWEETGGLSTVMEVESADLLLEVWRETEAGTEPFALNRPEDGGAAGGWEAGRLGSGGVGGKTRTLGLRYLLGLPVRCQADRSTSLELRGEVWAGI